MVWVVSKLVNDRLFFLQKDIEQGDKMRSTGEQLIMDEHYAVDSIRPKCVELQRMCDQYRELLRRRRELLTKSHDLHDRIDRVGYLFNHLHSLWFYACNLHTFVHWLNIQKGGECEIYTGIQV